MLMLSIRRSLSHTLLLGLLAAGCGSSDPDPAGAGTTQKGPLTVQTDKGAVEGSLLGSTRAFLGIPFAAPPTGDLRWKPPAPAEPWTATLKATAKGPSCAQLGALSKTLDTTSSEDCLTVNVWTPEALAPAPRPVLVWIHGGAFVLGSGGEDAYDGQLLSEATGAVVVTLNYRLGPFGFLALPELKSEDAGHPSTGAYGLEDQRAALQWVKENIDSFGGDPGRVTLFGESAGGISTCMHLVSPKSKGLFQRAIIESGPCDTGATEATAEAQGATFAETLGCDGGDKLACLRGKSTEEVANALPLSNDFIFGGGASWFPVIDGYNLPDQPGKLFEAGSFEKVPVILGSNADEASLFFTLAGTMVADEAAFETLAEGLVPGHGKDVVSHYPAAMYGSAQKAAMAAVTDAGFACPTRRAARAMTGAGGTAYLYHFTYAPKGGLFGDLGSFHSAEIKYVFGVPSQLLPHELTDEELALSASVMGYWSRHAASGDPNGGGAPEWPKYDEASDQDIVLTTTIAKESGLKKDLCDFWDGIVIPAP